MIATGFSSLAAAVVAALTGYSLLRLVLFYPALLYFWFLSSLALVVLLNLLVAYHFNVRRRGVAPASQTTKPAAPLCHLRPLAFTRPDSWPAVTARRTKERSAVVGADVLLFPKYPRASVALETTIDFILRDFVVTWYKGISADPAFVLAVERAVRASFLAFGSRAQSMDTLLLVTGRVIPVLTRHIRGCQQADRAVRRQQLGRSVRDAGDLNELLASKYRDGRLHPAVCGSRGGGGEEGTARSAGSVDLAYLRNIVDAILPYILPPVEVQSRCLRLIAREIVAGAVFRPLMNMLADPDYWNQVLLRLLTSMKAHHVKKPYEQGPSTNMLGVANDRASKRSYEAFLKAINDCDNLVECKSMRSDIIAEMRYRRSLIDGKSEDEYVNGVKVQHVLVYLNRLFLAKKKADRRIAFLGGGSLKVNRRSSFMRYLKDSAVVISLREVLRSENGRRLWESFVQPRQTLDRTLFWLAVDDINRGLPKLSLVAETDDWRRAFETKRAILFNLYDEFLAPEVVRSLGIEAPLAAEIDSLVNDLATSGGTNSTPRDLPPATCDLASDQTDNQLSEKLAAAYRYVGEAHAAVERRMQDEDWPLFVQSEVYRRFASEYHRTHAADGLDISQRQAGAQSQDHSSAGPKRTHGQASEADRGPDDRGFGAFFTQSYMVAEPESAVAESSDYEQLEPPAAGIISAGDFERAESPATGPDQGVPVVHPDTGLEDTVLSGPRYPTSLYRRPQSSPELTGDPNKKRPANEPTAGLPPPKQLNLWDWAPRILGPFYRTSAGAVYPASNPNDAGDDSAQPADPQTNAATTGEPMYDPLASPPPRIKQRSNSCGNGDGAIPWHPGVDFGAAPSPPSADVQLAAPGDLLLESEVSRISSELYALATEETRLDAEMAEADRSGSLEKSIRLKKEKLALSKKVKDAGEQKARYERQARENALVPGKTQVYIRTWYIKRDASNKEYAVFVIDVHQTSSEGIPLRGWLVERRYSEFWSLHQQLKKAIPEVVNCGFPTKRAVLNTGTKFIEMRRLALQNYLRTVLRMEEACSSEDLRVFLCQRSVEGSVTAEISAPVEDEVAQARPPESKKSIIKNIYKVVSEGIEDRTGSLWEAAKQIPRSSSGSTSGLTAATPRRSTSTCNCEAASSSSSLSALSDELRAESGVPSTTESLCDLFSEVFELKENNNWLRRRSVIRILQQLFEGAVERRIRETIDSVMREDMVVQIRDALWPGGYWPSSPQPARTMAQKQQTKSEALYFLTTFVPDLLGGFVVRQNARRGARRIFNAIQNPILNQHLIYCLFDEVVLACYGHEAADVVWTRHSTDSFESPRNSA